MGARGVPNLDFALASSEDLSHFAHIPWAQSFWEDFTYTPVVNLIPGGRPGPVDSKTVRRTFFTSTLWTPATIRASRLFYKSPIPPTRWSGPPPLPESQEDLGACMMLCSLGGGLTGGQADSAHGGLIATLLDEALGTPVFCQVLHGSMTADLKTQYVKPLPVPGVVLCRSWVEKEEGRKVWSKAVIEDGNGDVYARGESLYIKLKANM